MTGEDQGLKGRNNIIIARLPEKLIPRVGNEAMVTVLTTRMGAIGPLEYGGVVDPTHKLVLLGKNDILLALSSRANRRRVPGLLSITWPSVISRI